MTFSHWITLLCCCWCLGISQVDSFYGPFSFRPNHLAQLLKSSPYRFSSTSSDNPVPSSGTSSTVEDVSGKPKGFGKVKPKPEKKEVEKDVGTLTYEKQSKRGVPEYNIFLRPSNGTDVEWIPVGSMTIPRDTSIAKAVYEVEAELLKGTFKIYPQMKKFYEEKKMKRLGDYERESIFEYGYCLKAFPDEPIILLKKEDATTAGKQESSNFFANWLSKLTNPIDTSEVKKQAPSLDST